MERNPSPVTHDSPVTHGAALTHGEYALTEEVEEIEGRAEGGLVIHWRLSVDQHKGCTGCHSGAKWRCVARRVATDRLNKNSSGGNTKTSQRIARRRLVKQKPDHLSFHQSLSTFLLIRTPCLNRTTSPPSHPHSKSGPCPLTVLSCVRAPHSPPLPVLLFLPLPPLQAQDYTQLCHLSNLPQTSQSTAPHANLKNDLLLLLFYGAVISARCATDYKIS